MNSGTSNHRTQTAQERKQEYDANQSLWKELKKMKERYPALKSRLEVCREARPLSISTVKDQQALQYFQTCQEQIQKKLDDVEQTVLRHKERYERELKALEKSLEYHLHVEDLRKAKLQDSMSFIQTRLTTAQERVTAGKERKTKEELSLEKEIREYYVRYRTLFPSAPDLLDVFPGISDLVDVSGNIPPTPSEVAPLPPIQPPVSEEPPASNPAFFPKPEEKVPVGKKYRYVNGKRVFVEDLPPVPLPPPVSEEPPEEIKESEEVEVQEEELKEEKVEVQEEELKKEEEETKEEPPPPPPPTYRPLINAKKKPEIHPAQLLSDKEVAKLRPDQLFSLLRPNERNPYSQPKILTSTKRPPQ